MGLAAHASNATGIGIAIFLANWDTRGAKKIYEVFASITFAAVKGPAAHVRSEPL